MQNKFGHKNTWCTESDTMTKIYFTKLSLPLGASRSRQKSLIWYVAGTLNYIIQELNMEGWDCAICFKIAFGYVE